MKRLVVLLVAACGGGNNAANPPVLSDAAEATPDGAAPIDASVESPCAIEGGGGTLCIKTRDSSLFCAGGNITSQLGYETPELMGYSMVFGRSQPALGGSIVQVAMGYGHACVRTAPGDLYCWGSNYAGELSVPGSSERPDPIQVRELGAQTQRVYTGDAFSCAQTTDGGLWCWGMNDEGQLGGGHLVDGPDPGQVEIIGTTATRIALGFDHACAVRDDGSLWCWGKFDNASERALEPVQIAQLAANIQEVAAGNRFTCVRKADDTAWCWGHIGPHADEDLGPASVVQLASDVVELTAGKNHACARTSDGTVWCWGDDQYAQLGDGMKRTGANAQAAIPVPLPGPAASLTSTDYGSCALDAAGDAWCWGSNGLGQFGLGHWDDVLPVTKIMTSCTPPTPPAL